jgi:hypothetical protein
MADGASDPCWCTQLPAVVPVPDAQAGCWCAACLRQHIAGRSLTERGPAEPEPSSSGVA